LFKRVLPVWAQEASWFLCFFTADSLVLTENRDRAVQLLLPQEFQKLVAVDVQEELFPARVGRVPPTSKEFADQVAKSRWLRIQRLLHLRSNYDADIYIWGNPLKDALRAEELAAICTRKIQHSPPWCSLRADQAELAGALGNPSRSERATTEIECIVSVLRV
jgi:hypothetical protein